jgi:predicted AAA+ superfamily ATPase
VFIQRRILRLILERLLDEPILLVEGPPRVGKTVLASQLVRATAGSGLLVDALSPGLEASLLEPGLALELVAGNSGTSTSSASGAATRNGPRSGRILVVDNADRNDSISATLAAASGKQGPRIVLLGKSFPVVSGLPRIELGPLNLIEVGQEALNLHWFRGGYPEAFFAHSDQAAMSWLRQSLDAMAESRFLSAGLPWAPGRTRNLLSMLGRSHGEALNENEIARSLGVSRPTVVRAVLALERSGILRRLPSLASPRGKRARKSEVLYVRDSGFLHATLGLETAQDLIGSPRLAASWEGYVIEQALAVMPPGMEAAAYRSQDGAGLEFVALEAGVPRLGAAIRWAKVGSKPPKGASIALADLGLTEGRLVLPSAEETDLGNGMRAESLIRFLGELSSLYS